MLFTKIKYDGAETELHIKSETDNKDDKEKIIFVSEDQPNDDFVEIYNQFKDVVSQICNLSDEYLSDCIIDCININHKNYTMYVQIKVLKYLRNYGVAKIESSFIPLEKRDGSVMPEGVDSMIENMSNLAEKYYNGDRQNGFSLFDTVEITEKDVIERTKKTNELLQIDSLRQIKQTLKDNDTTVEVTFGGAK